jgi:hypothetical protein
LGLVKEENLTYFQSVGEALNEVINPMCTYTSEGVAYACNPLFPRLASAVISMVAVPVPLMKSGVQVSSCAFREVVQQSNVIMQMTRMGMLCNRLRVYFTHCECRVFFAYYKKTKL